MTQSFPAPYSAPIVHLMRILLSQPPKRIRALDPFAGVGRGLRAFPPKSKVTLVEIEKEWAEDCRLQAALYPDLDVTVIHGDSRYSIPRRKYNLIVTSPSYGNRFADPLRVKPGVNCRSYAQSLGRAPSEGSTASKDFGWEYMTLNREVMLSALSRLESGGEVWINISDHYRTPPKAKKTDPPNEPVRIPVSRFWIDMLDGMGFMLREAHPIRTKRSKEGENRHRVPFESLLIFEDVRGTPPSTRATQRRSPARAKK